MKKYIVQAIAQETIDSFDAHNAPELVRCKDCKHRSVYQSGLKCVWCPVHAEWHDNNWFCADGERKDT